MIEILSLSPYFHFFSALKQSIVKHYIKKFTHKKTRHLNSVLHINIIYYSFKNSFLHFVQKLHRGDASFRKLHHERAIKE